uniref:Putative u3 small nucleolar rna-associated protein 6 n=1 Tax=Xenopsylla cheopis TaxID=163159 RepID=A0A6M2DFR0_XENCH
MDEFVDNHVESMITEMKLMLRYNIFTKDEVELLIRRRKNFENQLKKHSKSKTDYINLITLETNLFRELKRRREQYNIKKDVDKIDFPLARHIDSLYKNALNSFANDVYLWTSYIQFCTTAEFNDSISKAFGKMLQIHSSKPQLWVMAAKWEKEKNRSLENALAYLVQGLVHHTNDVLLHTEAFNITLLQARDKNVPDITQAEIMYNSALKNVKDVHFLIGLLKICERYNFVEVLEKRIINDLKVMFPKDEIVFHTVAQKTLLNRNSDQLNSTEKFEMCISLYKEAVRDIPTEKMWCYYIDTLIELNEDKEIFIVDERKALETALEDGYNANMLSVRHYLQWFEILSSQVGNEEKTLKIMNEVTSKNEKSLDLWKASLRFHFKHSDSTIVKQVFDQAVAALGENSLAIWKMMIMYYLIDIDSSDKLRALYIDALKQPACISDYIKPKYLEWLTITKNIVWARNAYKAMATLPPFCLELHRKMAFLESLQTEPDMKNWRDTHTNATYLFGKNNKDVWIDFIKFELEHGDASEIPAICAKAKENLNSSLLDIFQLDLNKISACTKMEDA